MMKEKKKGLLQRGIMVAVSALTIVAGAGTVLAYEPMQWSDGSFEETISDNTTFLSFDIINVDNIDFSNGNEVFVYPDGSQININSESTHILCTHSMVNGYYSVHDALSGGRCKVTVYTAQRCEKCGYLANAKYYSTTTYAKCPH